MSIAYITKKSIKQYANIYFVMNVPNGRPRKDGEPVKPYCQVHANLLYNIENRTYQDCILQLKSLANERDAAIDMLKRLDCGRYIVIMDRGYDGFNMIETCNRLPDCHYIIRTKAGYGLQILHGEYPLLIKELLFPLYVFLFLSLMDDTDRQFGLWNFFVFRFTI